MNLNILKAQTDGYPATAHRPSYTQFNIAFSASKSNGQAHCRLVFHSAHPEKHPATQFALTLTIQHISRMINKSREGRLGVMIGNQMWRINIALPVPCVDWCMAAETIVNCWPAGSLHGGYMFSVTKPNFKKTFLGKTALELTDVAITPKKRLVKG